MRVYIAVQFNRDPQVETALSRHQRDFFQCAMVGYQWCERAVNVLRAAYRGIYGRARENSIRC